MNIFVSSEIPEVAASNLDSKRVNKMLLESCQMLCTAINEHGGQSPYKSTHKNHPANMWVRQTRENFYWLFKHANELSKIYTNETNKVHKCQDILNYIMFNKLDLLIPEGSLTEFVNCAAHNGKQISYKHIKNVINAYQMYLNDRWETDIRKPVWINRKKPEWALIK